MVGLILNFNSNPFIYLSFIQVNQFNSCQFHFRNLCDIKQNGKLNSEQFALAMYLVQQKLQGIEVPATLYSEMIPPTLRPKPTTDIPQQVLSFPFNSILYTIESWQSEFLSPEILRNRKASEGFCGKNMKYTHKK